MTADRTTAAESTPRRGFGVARFVRRAVAGAVEATREAARAVDLALAELALRSTEAKIRRMSATRRARRPRAAAVACGPLWLRRLIEAINQTCWLEQQPIITLSHACRRFYLRTAAMPLTPYHEVERATRVERAAAQEARQDELYAHLIASRAFDRHRPPPPSLERVSGRVASRAPVPIGTRVATLWLTPSLAPPRPT